MAADPAESGSRRRRSGQLILVRPQDLSRPVAGWRELTGCHPRRPGLHTLALARQDQALEVEGRPAPPPRQERLEQALKLVHPASSREVAAATLAILARR